MTNMKNLLNLMMCILLVMNVQAQEKNKGIRFERDLSWEQVKAKAKAENKFIFVDAYTTWCGPCKMMDKDVFPNDTVGDFMNKRFISVKVQMDRTGRDNEQVKSWYAAAGQIEKEYQVPGYPCFLFLASDGRLAYRELGYKPVAEFVQMALKAFDPQNLIYYTQLDDYKKGKKNYEDMDELAVFVQKIIGDNELAKQVAEDYIKQQQRQQLLSLDKIRFVRDVAKNRKLANELAKEYGESYLDKLSEDELSKKEVFFFFNEFSHLITSKSKYFQLCYRKPQRIDSIFKGASANFVRNTIYREEITPILFKDDKPVFKNPDWNKISETIRQKYPEVDEKVLVLNYQVSYYRKINDWRQWANYMDQKFKANPGVKPNNAFWDLNLPAWDVFLYCNDEKVLTKALEWVDLAIKIEEAKPNTQCLDTRANLLYKLGRVKEAITQEEQAAEIALSHSRLPGYNAEELVKSAGDYKEIARKMSKGEPTYLEEGAIWNAKTLKNIQPKKIGGIAHNN